MSLALPRPAEAERASVLLPTVTCSSCAAPIPISSLGDHICQPMPPAPAPARATGSRMAPRPSHLTIPASRPSNGSPLAQSSISSSSSGSRPFAGPTSVSSGSRPSPSALEIPARSSSAHAPSPLSASGGPQFLAQPSSSSSRTPSPTNPFFPHPDQGNGVVIHGLGLGVGASSRGGESPYPTDRQLPAGINGPGLSDGASGMAGVGRRAFAAAAWGVRAGVAMANGAAGRSSPVDQVHPPVPSPHPSHSAHAPSPHPIYQQPQQQPAGRQTPSPPHATTAMPVPAPRSLPQSREHLPPSAPLANRPQPTRKPSASSVNIPERSTSAMSQRSVTGPSITADVHRRKESVSSNGSQRSGDGESISQLLKARAAGEPAAEQKKPAFFEKYKQFVSDGRNSPSMGAKSGLITNSPENVALRIEEEDDEEESALPWATKEDKPAAPPVASGSRSHSRQPTLDSASSHSSSSSRSGMNGGGSSGAESEEIVTPSQSWEGSLVERVTAGMGSRKPHDSDSRDHLEQIGEEDEEDEGDRVVFGFQPQHTAKPHTHSQTIKTRLTDPDLSVREASHARSRTVPDLPSSSSSRTPRANTSKRTKQCQKCLEIVGGTKRFVERDGIVLCEKDWKKLYLPSCRRCHLPIEKSAVSSSDGQLKGKWHKACFSCTKCSKPFEGDSFYVLEGKPWCQYHYHEEK